MLDKLTEEKNTIEFDIAKLDRKFSKIAVARLIVFLVAVVLAFIGITENKPIFIGLGVIGFITFIVLVKIHADLDEKVLAAKAKAKVINRYIMRLNNEWKGFEDDGSQFLLSGDNLSYDLDLLGKNSLYQLINVAHTDLGRRKLANTLSLKSDNSKKLDNRYDAISELASKSNFMLDFESTLERIVDRRKKQNERMADLSGESLEDIEKKEADKAREMNDPKKKKVFPAWMFVPMILVPVLNAVSIVQVLVFDKNPIFILATFIIGLVITGATSSVVEPIVGAVSQYGSSAKDYYKVLKLIADEEFSSEILKDILKRLNSRDGLIKAIDDMGKLSALYGLSYNALVYMILNGFLGFDYFVALLASNWNKKNEGVFTECIDIISDVEELGSIAVLSLVRKLVKPSVNIGGEIKISAENVLHPLLDTDKVVANSAQLDKRLTVITGSNMSGKTTFLRTIAINMVLAYIGSGVCAKSFSVPYMKLFTSMRVMDDVSGGISTFYAEILRIKEMAEYVGANQSVPALCLIDEIFKGTNSADRIVGAENALVKLSKGNSMVLVSTHDFELCDIQTEDGVPAENYHFQEYYENGKLMFDYTIKDGKCTTRNAMAILEMAGLVQM